VIQRAHANAWGAAVVPGGSVVPANAVLFQPEDCAGNRNDRKAPTNVPRYSCPSRTRLPTRCPAPRAAGRSESTRREGREFRPHHTETIQPDLHPWKTSVWIDRTFFANSTQSHVSESALILSKSQSVNSSNSVGYKSLGDCRVFALWKSPCMARTLPLQE
jgi:hypothetical protein